VSWVCIQFIK